MPIAYRAPRHDEFNDLLALLAVCGIERGAAIPDRFRLQLKNAVRQ